MAPNQTLASATTPGTKLQQMLLVLTNPLVIGSSKNPRCFYRVNRNSLPRSYYANSNAWIRSDIFATKLTSKKLWNILHKLGIHIQQALIAQEMAGQGDQEGTDLLLQQFSPIENVSDKSLEEMNQYLEMIDCKNNYLLEN
ncbi:3394_t:CDS:2 [Rhizophagus irregularis]|nr:3394_t:CDS:2 [Rhizophagus irregularis]